MSRSGYNKEVETGGRLTPACEGIVPCRPASHAGRERVWGSCGERGHKLGSRWVDQRSQEVVPFFSIRTPPPPKFFFRQGRKGAEGAGFFFTLELDRRNRMEIYHSEAWPSEQLHAGIIRNPAGTIVWCHSMVS